MPPATAMKVAAAESPLSTRMPMPPSQVLSQMISPSRAVKPESSSRNSTTQPTTQATRNGQAVVQMPAKSSPSPWLARPTIEKPNTKTRSKSKEMKRCTTPR